MNVEVTKLPESRVALKIELSPAEVEGALDRTYKQLVQRVNIPGFRKGKAPREVVERMVGPEWFLHEATEEAIRWAYRKAVDQENLVPIDEAEISGVEDEHAHLHTGEAFTFEARVAVKPEVQLPDYHALHIDRPEVEVSDEDVDSLTRDLQERTATLEPTSSPADTGMVVTMNLTGRVDGEEVLNEENAEYELRDEEHGQPDPVFPGLSRELIGIKPGDIREISLNLPDGYGDPAMAGKTLALHVLGKEVKRKVLPDLNDEFAQTVSELETLDELRDRLRANIELERRYEADQRLVNEVVEAVSGRTFVEIPPILVEEELDRAMDEMRRAFEEQRLSFSTYLETTGKSEQDVRNDMREEATQNVKRSLVLGAVAEREGIQVSGRELDAGIAEVLRTMNLSEAERRRLRSSSGVRANIRNRLERQRAIQRLVEVVTGDGVSPEAAEAIADQTAATAEDTEETVAVEVGG